MEELLLSLAKLSPVVGILVSIVWMLSKRVDRNELAAQLRETNLIARLDAVQGAQAAEMKEVIKANTSSNFSVTTACTELRQVNEQIVVALNLRPCLLDPPPNRTPDSAKPMKTPIPGKGHH